MRARRQHRVAWPRYVLSFAAPLGIAFALGGCYVLHLAAGQLDQINAQQPLPVAIRDERSPDRKLLLAEVPFITRFAVEVLRMEPTDSYVGYYAVPRDWLTLVLSAAPRDRLEPYTRWFPFAGRVPYRAFFDEARARRAQAQLESEGYDTLLHPSPAYSTLGAFRDPVTSPMLDDRLPCPPEASASALDSCRVAALAETLLHELTHQNLYVPGETDFNEQLASFVGRTGAIEYLASRGLYDEPLRQRLQVAFGRQQAFADYVAEAAHELEALYASAAPLAEKVRLREPVFTRITERGLALFPDAQRDDLRFNNARVLQGLRYARSAERLTDIWKNANGRWPRFWRLVRAHAHSG